MINVNFLHTLTLLKLNQHANRHLIRTLNFIKKSFLKCNLNNIFHDKYFQPKLKKVRQTNKNNKTNQLKIRI